MTVPLEKRRSGARVPPANQEAEESVLGAMMLSSDAANVVIERLQAEDFYKPTHQLIYEAILELYNANQPVDAITVSDTLRRKERLEQVGGVSYLTELLDSVPATSNADYYAGIVEEHALRRRLVRAGTVIGELAFDTDQDLANVLDQAEQTVFAVAEKRVGEGLIPVRPLLTTALESIEEMGAQGSEITGLSTGFRDLDRKLGGLHPSNLVIVAARPSMGKSALALNIAQSAAAQDVPVAIFSLEMTRQELVQRMLCSLGRVDSQKLRTGQLGQQHWQKIVRAAAQLFEVPIYLDDSPYITATEIRAKCRRLKRQHDLGLVVVDYLQLMESHTRTENRQQEIAEISRALKNLARELEVPIVAVSQLNRALESRQDKHPMLGDLRECLTADTPIRRADTGGTVTIGELARSGARNVPVWSLAPGMKLVRSTMAKAWSTGVKPVFKVRTASGRTVRATGNHPLLTLDGWLPVSALKAGDRIAVPRLLPTPSDPAPMSQDEIVLLAHLIGDGSYLAHQPLRYTSNDPANHTAVAEAARRRFGVESVIQDLPDSSWQTRLPAPYRLTHGRRNPICEWLDEHGIFDQRSHEKRVPKVVFGLPKEQLRLFLRHLWATDGSITMYEPRRQCRIYYASSSRGLIDDVNALLLRLNFQPRIREVSQGRYGSSWTVDISGVDQQRRFLNEIGCHGRRGDAIPAILGALSGIRSNPNVDTVPHQVWEEVRRIMTASGVSSPELSAAMGLTYPVRALFRHSPTRFTLATVAEALDDGGLRALTESDVLWDSIVSIMPDGEEEVFDALVPKLHNFCAGEVIVHNSGQIEQDADVVMFIYRDEYYHPENQEAKGLAEVDIAKHRNGATGRVQMTFLAEFTLFADLGRDVAA